MSYSEEGSTGSQTAGGDGEETGKGEIDSCRHLPPTAPELGDREGKAKLGSSGSSGFAREREKPRLSESQRCCK